MSEDQNPSGTPLVPEESIFGKKIEAVEASIFSDRGAKPEASAEGERLVFGRGIPSVEEGSLFVNVRRDPSMNNGCGDSSHPSIFSSGAYPNVHQEHTVEAFESSDPDSSSIFPEGHTEVPRQLERIFGLDPFIPDEIDVEILRGYWPEIQPHHIARALELFDERRIGSDPHGSFLLFGAEVQEGWLVSQKRLIDLMADSALKGANSLVFDIVDGLEKFDLTKLRNGRVEIFGFSIGGSSGKRKAEFERFRNEVERQSSALHLKLDALLPIRRQMKEVLKNADTAIEEIDTHVLVIRFLLEHGCMQSLDDPEEMRNVLMARMASLQETKLQIMQTRIVKNARKFVTEFILMVQDVVLNDIPNWMQDYLLVLTDDGTGSMESLEERRMGIVKRIKEVIKP